MSGGDTAAASQEKLRLTCNQCALSKVRCNKRKPTCQRCEKLGFECVYDLARRRGKLRSSHQQRSMDANTTPLTTENGLYDWSNSSVSSFTNVAMDLFSQFPDLLPGPGTFDCNDLWTDPANSIIYDAGWDSKREGSSNDGITIDGDSPAVIEQQQPQTSDSSVSMTFAPLGKPCQGETCTSTAFCTLGTL